MKLGILGGNIGRTSGINIEAIRRAESMGFDSALGVASFGSVHSDREEQLSIGHQRDDRVCGNLCHRSY